LLEKDSLMRGMLIEEDQAAIGFEEDVKPADHADQPERNVEQWYRRLIVRVYSGDWDRTGG
jgi:hypothetical protein